MTAHETLYDVREQTGNPAHASVDDMIDLYSRGRKIHAPTTRMLICRIAGIPDSSDEYSRFGLPVNRGGIVRPVDRY